MPGRGTSDAQRLERLMRRHAQGKISDAQLIAAQEQMLGGWSGRGGQGSPSSDPARQAYLGSDGTTTGPVRERLTRSGQHSGGPQQARGPQQGSGSAQPGGGQGRRDTDTDSEGTSGRQVVLQFVTFLVVAIVILILRRLGG